MDVSFPYQISLSSVIQKDEALHFGKAFCFNEKKQVCFIAENNECKSTRSGLMGSKDCSYKYKRW